MDLIRTSFYLALLLCATGATAQKLDLLSSPQDPYGFPRPGAGQKNVPLRTSFFFQLGITKSGEDEVAPESVSVQLQPTGGPVVDLVSHGEIGADFSGRMFPSTRGFSSDPVLAVYITPDNPLQSNLTYTIRIQAKTRGGLELSSREGTWSFTTETADRTHRLSLELDFSKPPVHWKGGFFTGFCKPSFCTTDPDMIKTYELMAQARAHYPRAWSLQRDFWLTGMDDKPGILAPKPPNLVRDLQTRRIVAMDHTESTTRLTLKDFLGHEQYGIPGDRTLRGDFHPGDKVLIADGVHSTRATVLGVDDPTGSLLVSRMATPPGGWTLDYLASPPAHEDPNAPGLFAIGGCYLRKFDPPGDPRYFWGRLNHEWDLAQKQGRRLMPNFADAPGDLSVDGRNWTTTRDYAQLHEVVRSITGHIIERYGKDSLSFVWSVFNEPDLGALFWRTNWTELQKFYDYTTDAILRAFEDRGYNSKNVFIGGLELGGIFGTNLRLEEFFSHCSPRSQGKRNEMNAAYQDPRLNGKRSWRVEDLCRSHAGRGAPCDFVSVHAYNRSELMAAKLAKAKEIALEVDSDYFANLWINSHESCPGWNPPPDPAAEESYLGNGYFATWCADVSRRLLARAADDPRYAFGETILTLWQFPSRNFQGLNTVTRLIAVDENGDGRTDKEALVANPIFHFLNLLSTMGPDFWVFEEHVRGGHVVSGFASRNHETVRIVLFSHNELDTQSRSEHTFKVKLNLSGLPLENSRLRQYRFDRENNSYYRLAKRLREANSQAMDARQLQDLIQLLKHGDRAIKLNTIRKLRDAGPDAHPALHALARLTEDSKDQEVRKASAEAMIAMAASRPACTVEEFRHVQASSKLTLSSETRHQPGPSGSLSLSLDLLANAVSFLVLEPDTP